MNTRELRARADVLDQLAIPRGHTALLLRTAADEIDRLQALLQSPPAHAEENPLATAFAEVISACALAHLWMGGTGDDADDEDYQKDREAVERILNKYQKPATDDLTQKGK